MSTPAEQAIRAHLRERRPAVPRTLLVTFLAGVVLLGAYAALLAFLWATDRALFNDMIRLYGLTLLAGREPAMFAVYQPPTPVPLGWMMVAALVDDLATLFLTISWVWLAFSRLQRVRAVQGWLVGLEKAALENRRWIRRWGLWGLAAFFWLPGWGSGVLAICVVGVAARIPLRRLVPVLAASAAGVSLFWAFALYQTSALLPADSIRWLPATILAVVVGGTLVMLAKEQRHAYIFLLEWPAPKGERAEALAPFGIRPHGGIIEVDSRQLAQALGEHRIPRGRAYAMAELLLIEGVQPPEATALSNAGLDGLTDLALLKPPLVQDVLQEAGLPPARDVTSWIAQASALAANEGETFRRK